MEITAQMVKELRELTGRRNDGLQKSFQRKNGVISDAVDYLREKGLGKAAKKTTDKLLKVLLHYL